MDYQELLQQIANTLEIIASNQSVLRDELSNINNSIQEISQTGVYNLKDVCDKLDSVDLQLTLIDGSIASIT